ncbi:MAG: carboxylesterase family protein [Desulfovibrio sp.]|nr:carboxylesterase family protein [Desulfovibrio sp.]
MKNLKPLRSWQKRLVTLLLLGVFLAAPLKICGFAGISEIWAQTLLEQKQLEAKNIEKAQLRAQYGVNQKITDGKYDPALAVKCINGTFVGKKTGNSIVYKGIPFVGKQPVGKLRWKAPVNFAPDNGVYEAYYNAKSAYGNEDFETGSLFYQGEDCLYLNIWKAAWPSQTNPASARLKPVMVWIHGGAFEAGGTVDPMFDCQSFVQENPDVIVVTIAYRLGVFGFLHIAHLPDGQDYQDAQNLGLLDQMMALKWIHENIEGFGGDPDKVTLFGESAGAASVTLLPLLKGSQAYFKRVIAQSGSPSQTRSTQKAIDCTNELLELLGCKTVADLKKIEPGKLNAASSVLNLRQFPERDGRYLPLDCYAAYANGAARQIDFLQGCNKDEMNFFVHDFGVEEFKKWAATRKAKGLALMSAADRALLESFGEDLDGESYEKDSRLFSQIWFNAPSIKLAESQIKGGGKAYTYYFTPESSLPIMKCGHSIELAIIFNHPEMTSDTGRKFDPTFSKTMRKMWVQFAKTGNPSLSAAISPDGKAKEWPLYDLKNKLVMVFDEFNIHPEKEAELKIVDWERMYPLTKYYMF